MTAQGFTNARDDGPRQDGAGGCPPASLASSAPTPSAFPRDAAFPLAGPGAPLNLTVVDQAPGVVATPARVEAWAKGAKPGDRFAYATLCMLPVKSAGAAAMRMLQAKGLVQLERRPVPDSLSGGVRLHTYSAKRLAKPWPVARGAPVGDVEVVAEVEQLAVDRVLPVLERAARFGRPCPTNHQIAERAELSVADVETGVAALRALELIAVTAAPPPTLRRVTILSNGWRTGAAA